MSLSKIQRELKAPKGQFNAFGKYHYRSCEDILEAVKPLLSDKEAIIITDDIISVGNRIYVKATASYSDGLTTISVSAFAREAETKKGMDEAQITGSASSYARKYALNGLLLCDDTKDADATNKHDKEPIEPVKKDMTIDFQNKLNMCESVKELTVIKNEIAANIHNIKDVEGLRKLYAIVENTLKGASNGI